MSGKTRCDIIWNDTTRERRFGVAPILENMVKNKLRLFGHVEREDR